MITLIIGFLIYSSAISANWLWLSVIADVTIVCALKRMPLLNFSTGTTNILNRNNDES